MVIKLKYVLKNEIEVNKVLEFLDLTDFYEQFMLYSVTEEEFNILIDKFVNFAKKHKLRSYSYAFSEILSLALTEFYRLNYVKISEYISMMECKNVKKLQDRIDKLKCLNNDVYLTDILNLLEYSIFYSIENKVVEFEEKITSADILKLKKNIIKELPNNIVNFNDYKERKR